MSDGLNVTEYLHGYNGYDYSSASGSPVAAMPQPMFATMSESPDGQVVLYAPQQIDSRVQLYNEATHNFEAQLNAHITANTGPVFDDLYQRLNVAVEAGNELLETTSNNHMALMVLNQAKEEEIAELRAVMTREGEQAAQVHTLLKAMIANCTKRFMDLEANQTEMRISFENLQTLRESFECLQKREQHNSLTLSSMSGEMEVMRTNLSDCYTGVMQVRHELQQMVRASVHNKKILETITAHHDKRMSAIEKSLDNAAVEVVSRSHATLEQLSAKLELIRSFLVKEINRLKDNTSQEMTRLTTDILNVRGDTRANLDKMQLITLRLATESEKVSAAQDAIKQWEERLSAVEELKGKFVEHCKMAATRTADDKTESGRIQQALESLLEFLGTKEDFELALARREVKTEGEPRVSSIMAALMKKQTALTRHVKESDSLIKSLKSEITALEEANADIIASLKEANGRRAITKEDVLSMLREELSKQVPAHQPQPIFSEAEVAQLRGVLKNNKDQSLKGLEQRLAVVEDKQATTALATQKSEANNINNCCPSCVSNFKAIREQIAALKVRRDDDFFASSDEDESSLEERKCRPEKCCPICPARIAELQSEILALKETVNATQINDVSAILSSSMLTIENAVSTKDPEGRMAQRGWVDGHDQIQARIVLGNEQPEAANFMVAYKEKYSFPYDLTLLRQMGRALNCVGTFLLRYPTEEKLRQRIVGLHDTCLGTGHPLDPQLLSKMRHIELAELACSMSLAQIHWSNVEKEKVGKGGKTTNLPHRATEVKKHIEAQYYTLVRARIKGLKCTAEEFQKQCVGGAAVQQSHIGANDLFPTVTVERLPDF